MASVVSDVARVSVYVRVGWAWGGHVGLLQSWVGEWSESFAALGR